MAATAKHGMDIRERAFEFSVRLLRFCRQLDQNDFAIRAISRQLLRAGTSIGANLEEAQAGETRADFIHKNAIALKERAKPVIGCGFSWPAALQRIQPRQRFSRRLRSC